MVEIAKIIKSNIPFISEKQKILFINNQDSFIYNLVNYICIISDADVKVVPNSISIAEIEQFNPEKIIISPGPGHPKYDTGNVIPIIRKFGKTTPILGVCLGHQAITEAYGEDQEKEYVGRAKMGPMHGKMSKIFHDGEFIFSKIENPCSVVRYHSLATKADLLPKYLKIIAMADDGTIMAIRHKKFPVFGVQFHPESIMMKPNGIHILANFLKISKKNSEVKKKC